MISSPSSIAFVRSSSQEASTSATIHMSGPNTSAAISFVPDAGRSGRNGSSNPWASSGVAKLAAMMPETDREGNRRKRPAGSDGYSRARMRPAELLAALMCTLCLGLAACGDSSDRSGEAAARTPLPAPEVPALTEDEQTVWAELPPDRSAIPVLLYHGIGPESDFANATDASYGVGTEEFARQMTMIQHAGYETVDLQTFIDFVEKKPVELPPRPLLLTFDDARADSWTGADGILARAGLHRRHVRRRRPRRRRRSRIPELG